MTTSPVPSVRKQLPIGIQILCEIRAGEHPDEGKSEVVGDLIRFGKCYFFAFHTALAKACCWTAETP